MKKVPGKFKDLPPSAKLEVVRPLLQLLKSSSTDRMKVLTSVSALSATLLVVATFNPNLILLDDGVRFLLSILLLLIPSSLFVYMRDLERVQARTRNSLDMFAEKRYKLRKRKIADIMLSKFPNYALLLLTAVILSILTLIWAHKIPEFVL